MWIFVFELKSEIIVYICFRYHVTRNSSDCFKIACSSPDRHLLLIFPHLLMEVFTTLELDRAKIPGATPTKIFILPLHMLTKTNQCGPVRNLPLHWI